MNLVIRSLENQDNKEQIFELCKQNNLTSAYYTTNINTWNFQYENNPLRKSWNSVLVDKDNNTIIGHMGLGPQVIRAFSSDWTAGLINNGVISDSARTKLLPFNHTKTFAITPLIDCCVNESYKDNVDITIANSIIHPLIWRTLKFRTLNVETKSTIHSNLKGLFKAYFELFGSIYKSSYKRFLALPYSIFIIVIQLIAKTISKFTSVSGSIKTGDLVVDRISTFNSEFDDLMSAFYAANPDVITCKRGIDYLNWKFTSEHFAIYTFKIKSKLVGYIILEKQVHNKIDNNFVVTDCVILDDYLYYTSAVFKRLVKGENIRISFLHFLSCNYTKKLFKQSIKQGFQFTLHPLIILGFDKKKRNVTSTFYYKINNKSDLTAEQKEAFEHPNWFITPMLFNPGYYY